jgi:DeoR/GlpR family transcriptional regulator of sugar metabolism
MGRSAPAKGEEMLAKQRQALILQEVRGAGSARVSELTVRLGVSDMTIRRDLEVLARTGLIDKVHGGAVLPGAPSSHEPGFETKSTLEHAAKAAIAAAAADQVPAGSAIGLSAGTTTFALAERLIGIPGVTIVTNSVRVVSLLGSGAAADQTARGASVVLTGGTRTPSDALVGPIADLTIRSLHLDLLFLGCHGIDPVAGLTTPNLAEAETNRAFVQAARKMTVVADHTKWGTVGLCSFADLSDVDTLITDDGLPPEARALAAGRVGNLVVANVTARATHPGHQARPDTHPAHPAEPGDGDLVRT